MNILVVSATAMEVNPLADWLESSPYHSSCEILISGPGIFFTTIHLNEKLHQKNYSLIIQIGIAGSFHPYLPIGSVCQVDREAFGDWGAMDHEEFIDLFSLGLWNPNQFPFSNGWLINPYSFPANHPILSKLPKAKGVTMNCATGNEMGVQRIRKKYNADIESLEGAVVAFLALQRSIPYLQIRSISNFVEPRNRKGWNIPLAIQNLNQSLIQLLPLLVI